jgi:hypothetical protein
MFVARCTLPFDSLSWFDRGYIQYLFISQSELGCAIGYIRTSNTGINVPFKVPDVSSKRNV